MLDSLVLGICFMVALLCVMVFLLLIVHIKNRREKTQFDERQVLIRGTAYRVSFIVSIFYMILCSLTDMFEIKWAIFTVQMIIGVLLVCSVFAIVCIFTNAYFGVTQKSPGKAIMKYIVVSLVLMIIYTAVAISNLRNGESPITDGALNLSSIFIIVPVFFFIISIALIIKVLLEKRASVEE